VPTQVSQDSLRPVERVRGEHRDGDGEEGLGEQLVVPEPGVLVEAGENSLAHVERVPMRGQLRLRLRLRRGLSKSRRGLRLWLWLGSGGAVIADRCRAIGGCHRVGGGTAVGAGAGAGAACSGAGTASTKFSSTSKYKI
jgi:hypothetical protein